jgi:H/ACA ribonucleoprotein complex subunit 4
MREGLEKEFLIRDEEETDPSYGKRPEDRSVGELLRYGVVNLDKPSGPTSHEVVTWVKRILEIERAGHTGTLDPKVTGVFPVLLGSATKIVRALLNSPKGYICLMRLHGNVKEERLREIFSQFEGRIYQRPPLKSSVRRRLRIREIYKISLKEIEDRDVLFEVECEAGTYIRKLCHDMGEVLLVGAHMAELRRIKSGPFTEEELYNLQDLKDAYVIWKEEGDESIIRKVIKPMEKALIHLPWIIIKDSAVDAVCHGADLAIPGILKVERTIKPGMTVGIFTLKGEVVAIGKSLKSADEVINEDRGIAVDIERVIMPRGTYPKIWRKS